MINEYRATTLVNKAYCTRRYPDIGVLFADDNNGAVGMVGTLKVFDRSRRGTALRVSVATLSRKSSGQ